MIEDINLIFFISLSCITLSLFLMNADHYIQQLFFKSELDFNTLSKQPNRKKRLEKKELYFYALTPDERQDALNIILDFIDNQKYFQKNPDYLQYDKSLITRFDSPAAFYFAQCEIDCFEESGFINAKPFDRTNFSLIIPIDFEPNDFIEKY